MLKWCLWCWVAPVLGGGVLTRLAGPWVPRSTHAWLLPQVPWGLCSMAVGALSSFALLWVGGPFGGLPGAADRCGFSHQNPHLCFHIVAAVCVFLLLSTCRCYWLFSTWFSNRGHGRVFYQVSTDVAAGCLALSRFSSSSSSVSVSPFSSLFSSLCSHCQGRHECIISTRINEYLELKLKHPYSFSQQMCLAQHRIQTIILLAVMLNRVKKRQNTHAVYHREKIQIIPDCWRSWSFVSGLVLKSVSVFAMKTWTFMYIWYQVTKRDNSWQTRVNYSSLLINSLVLFYSQSQIASEKTENRK